MRPLFELVGIVFLRFPPLLRVWIALLVLVNTLSLCFLDTVYGRAALGAVAVGIVIMVVIYRRLGYVRLLGIGHVLWIPMLPWMVYKLPEVSRDGWLYPWMVCLVVLNSICFVVDTVDVVRFLRGDREPHYVWKHQATE